ncbi:MAG: elongation factor 1-beta [Candidatus Aenigmarchaeota archaeon]|nr:elongation factor 1-beta [Candidatus Aenigmarchaeota archaeon]
MPEDPSKSLDVVRANILKMGAREVIERPIAFGVKFLDVLFVVPDSEGGELDEKLKKLPGVGSVETEGITLI